MKCVGIEKGDGWRLSYGEVLKECNIIWRDLDLWK